MNISLFCSSQGPVSLRSGTDAFEFLRLLALVRADWSGHARYLRLNSYLARKSLMNAVRNQQRAGSW
jgi:hypothetical protein